MGWLTGDVIKSGITFESELAEHFHGLIANNGHINNKTVFGTARLIGTDTEHRYWPHDQQ